MRCSNVYERFVSTRQKIPRSSDNTCPLLSLPRLRTRAWKSRIVDLERPCFHTVLVTRSRPMNISTLHTVHTPCNTRIPRVFVSSIVPPLIVAIDLFSRSKSIDRTKDDVERRILFFFDLLSRLRRRGRRWGSRLEPLSQLPWNGFCCYLKTSCRDMILEIGNLKLFFLRKNFLKKRYLLFAPGDDYRMLALQMRLTSVSYLTELP